MILVNGKEIDITTFPDGTHLIQLEERDEELKVEWLYESDAELFQLICIRNHLKDKTIHLKMPYLPNARMDRVQNKKEVFMLKHFAEVMNSLDFKTVEVLDVHSTVSMELLDRVINKSAKEYIQRAMKQIKEDIILYFPDEGAKNRYEKELGLPCIYGRKNRNWDTGKIEGLEIIGDISLKGKSVLMVDDICSYGGTFYYSAKELMNRGVNAIYSYSTHTEKSLLSEKSKYYPLLQSGTVKKHFTTKSIFTQVSDYIEIL